MLIMKGVELLVVCEVLIFCNVLQSNSNVHDFNKRECLVINRGGQSHRWDSLNRHNELCQL